MRTCSQRHEIAEALSCAMGEIAASRCRVVKPRQIAYPITGLIMETPRNRALRQVE